MTSVGNPGDCMPGLVARDNKAFLHSAIPSCGPALARFRRVVNAISAKRLSFREVVEETGHLEDFGGSFVTFVEVVDCLASFQVTMAAFDLL